MKKFFALFLAVILCVGMLAACGEKAEVEKEAEKKPEQSVTPDNGDDGADDKTDPPEQGALQGTTYDTGAFTVFIPTGWKEFSVYDVFADEPNTVDPDALQIIKGGTDGMDIFEKPYIDIRYYGPDNQGMEPYRDFYDDVEDIDPLELDNYTFTGFDCVSFDYPMTILWADDGTHQFQVTVYTDQADGDIMITDEDVLQLIESILPKAD